MWLALRFLPAAAEGPRPARLCPATQPGKQGCCTRPAGFPTCSGVSAHGGNGARTDVLPPTCMDFRAPYGRRPIFLGPVSNTALTPTRALHSWLPWVWGSSPGGESRTKSQCRATHSPAHAPARPPDVPSSRTHRGRGATCKLAALPPLGAPFAALLGTAGRAPGEAAERGQLCWWTRFRRISGGREPSTKPEQGKPRGGPQAASGRWTPRE